MMGGGLLAPFELANSGCVTVYLRPKLKKIFQTSRTVNDYNNTVTVVDGPVNSPEKCLVSGSGCEGCINHNAKI